MLPLLSALKQRLLYEPVFLLTSLAAVAVVLRDDIPLPKWLIGLAVVVHGIAVRAVVKPVR